ncbi:DUF4239 domain-containing protein [Streptosporangium carneum]|uniref:DUF4239 domain-containing protein n=1 Tax=Streptosporangium carneum TaxID=47481 RepID=A0A9W6HWX8_9ACTN|nr:DUF4239 domain-containing protein [Streptosporangium carneum]GLK06859.1 hypothetical protein GCM10017600_02640 [Streptosporangium carneum]
MGWISVLVVVSVAITLIALLVLRRKGREGEDHGSASVDFAANLALAVYLLVLAYAVVLCRDAISTTQTDVQAETETLSEMYWSVAPIPEAAPLRARIRDYSAKSVSLDWPLMARGEMSPVPTKVLEDMRAEVIRLRPASDESKVLQQNAVSHVSEIAHARAVRADDANTGLESIFVISMLISGLLVVVLPWTVGTRPTGASIVGDLVRVSVVVIGIGFIMLISHPFNGLGAVGPDDFVAVQKQYDQIDAQFPAQFPAG